MFSCFCANKKPQRFRKSIKSGDIHFAHSMQKVSDKIIKEAEGSTTIDTPNIMASKESYSKARLQLVQQPIIPPEIKRISSVKQESNESGSILNTSFSSDSDTVPYMSKKQVSESSTPRQKKFTAKKSKQSKLKKLRQGNTPIERLFSLQKQQPVFHSRPALQISHGNFSNKASVSVDYSKYSEHDRQINSNDILDLDEEMESKLQELEQLPLQEAKSRLSESVKLSNRQKQSKDDKVHSRFQKQKKQECIEQDFDQLQKAEEDIHKNLLKKSNALMKSKYQGSLKMVKFSIPKNQPKPLEEPQAKQTTLYELVQKTVKQQLDEIEQQTNMFFCDQQSLKAPQSLDTFRKTFIYEQIEDNEETLEEAENSFHCNSTNEEFSRAIITKQPNLALKIFQKMTYQEKNSPDPKGYHPVHLTILQAIVDDKTVDLAKKLMYNPEVKMNVKGPTGWTPLQQAISYKHIRLTPNVFVASHRKKLSLIRQSLVESSSILQKMKDFEFNLEVKVDSFIPLVGNLTPNDTITITKKGNKLLIDYTLVGYEFLSCKRRDMGFLLNGETILALNRSKGQYCDLLEELDKQEIQMLVVQSLQTQTKKVDPFIKQVEINQARTIFDNEVVDKINDYHSKKYLFAINYTSMTEKRMPQKLTSDKQLNINETDSPLNFLSSWEKYLNYEHKVNIKPKNRNKKIELQMWLSEQFLFQIQNLIKIFQLFALSNPLAKTISDFLARHFSTLDSFKGKFPVKIDIPINYSLYFNLEFKGLKFDNFKKESLEEESKINKISRKEFQNIAQSKEKRAFAISAFT